MKLRETEPRLWITRAERTGAGIASFIGFLPLVFLPLDKQLCYRMRMATIIALVSQKGGVGKSTLARALAREAAVSGLG